MATLLVAVVLFVVAWIAHVAWWRMRVPRTHTPALLLVFGLTLLGGIACWWIAGSAAIVSLPDVPAIVALYVGAVGCYLIVYTGVEQASPSVAIFQTLQAAGESGCSVDEIAASITEERFLEPRLRALRSGGLIAETKGGCVLTSRGRIAASIAKWCAGIFNIRETA